MSEETLWAGPRESRIESRIEFRSAPPLQDVPANPLMR